MQRTKTNITLGVKFSMKIPFQHLFCFVHASTLTLLKEFLVLAVHIGFNFHLSHASNAYALKVSQIEGTTIQAESAVENEMQTDPALMDT